MTSILDIIAIPLGYIMKFIYQYVGNYGITLILFTLFTKIILFPLAIKQKVSSIRMSAFQPIMAEVQKKYKDDKAKQQEEIVRLQKEHGFSMTGGCLPLLIQMPILFGLIQVIYNPLRHVIGISKDLVANAAPIAEELGGTVSKYSAELSVLSAVKENAAPFAKVFSGEQISAMQNFNMNFLGFDLTSTPSLKVFNMLWLIPIISVVAMVAHQIIMTKLNGQKMEGAMKFMPFYSAIMFGYFGFVIPAGVTIYWIFSSVFGIMQELILRIFFDPDKEKAKIEEEVAQARKAAKQGARKVAAPNQDGKMTASQAELAKKRLEMARAQDKEKYGE